MKVHIEVLLKLFFPKISKIWSRGSHRVPTGAALMLLLPPTAAVLPAGIARPRATHPTLKS
jgi:hypothetical protein